MKSTIRRILREENNRIIDRVVDHFIKNRCEFVTTNSLDRNSNYIKKVYMDIDRGVDEKLQFTVSFIGNELHDFINHKEIKRRELLDDLEAMGDYPLYHSLILKILRSYGLSDDEVVETYIQILSKIKDKLLKNV
jgi:F0F1-type ATP synthase gamma subunit